MSEEGIDRLAESIAKKLPFMAPEAMPGIIREYLATAWSRGRAEERRVLARALVRIADEQREVARNLNSPAAAANAAILESIADEWQPAGPKEGNEP